MVTPTCAQHQYSIRLWALDWHSNGRTQYAFTANICITASLFPEEIDWNTKIQCTNSDSKSTLYCIKNCVKNLSQVELVFETIRETFDHNGHVSGTDSANSLISELEEYLTYAKQHNVFVFLTLWNGALRKQGNEKLQGLVQDTAKLQVCILKNHGIK